MPKKKNQVNRFIAGIMKRQVRAQEALSDYLDGDDRQSPVVDLLTDLRHWSELFEVDFDACVRISKDHYQEEK